MYQRGNIHNDTNMPWNNYLSRFGRFGWLFGFDRTEDILGSVWFTPIRGNNQTKPN